MELKVRKGSEDMRRSDADTFGTFSLLRGSAFFLVVTAVFGGWYGGLLGVSGVLELPPASEDGFEYDNIALNLARDRGFGLFWSDPEWRAPYQQHIETAGNDWVLQHHGAFYRSAFRPPLFPALVATTYTSTPRSFVTWRVVACICVVLTIALSCLLAYRWAGPTAGIATAGLWAIDATFRDNIHRFMTEPLAALGIVGLLWMLHRQRSGDRPVHTIVIATLCGLLILLRSIFLLWLPVLIALSLSYVQRERRVHRLLLFTGILLVLLAPWAARNCQLTNSFLPFGTQGWAILPLGYSDEALRNGGVWTGEQRDRLVQQHPETGLASIDAEVARSRIGKQLVTNWLAENWHRVPLLMSYKFASLWSTDLHRTQLVIVIIAALGALISLRSQHTNLLLLILAANTIAVVMTWNVPHGRFLVPTHPVLHLLGGLGIAGLLQRYGRHRG